MGMDCAACHCDGDGLSLPVGCSAGKLDPVSKYLERFASRSFFPLADGIRGNFAVFSRTREMQEYAQAIRGSLQ